jgi:hypothetical protein
MTLAVVGLGLGLGLELGLGLVSLKNCKKDAQCEAGYREVVL